MLLRPSFRLAGPSACSYQKPREAPCLAATVHLLGLLKRPDAGNVVEQLAPPPGDDGVERSTFQSRELIEVELGADIRLARFGDAVRLPASRVVGQLGDVAGGERDPGVGSLHPDVIERTEHPWRRRFLGIRLTLLHALRRRWRGRAKQRDSQPERCPARHAPLGSAKATMLSPCFVPSVPWPPAAITTN